MASQAFNLVGPQPQQAQSSPLAGMALGYGGTGAIPGVQQNEYLAQALDQLQQSGAQASKTPLALGANLLADALLTYSRNKNNKALLSEVQQGQAAAMRNASQGTGLNPDGTMAAPASASEGGPSPGMSAGPPITPVASASLPDVLAPAPPAASPQQQMLADLVQRGLSPIVAAGLVGNMTQESGPSLNRDNPAEGAIGAANWRGPRAAAAQAYFGAHGGPTLDNQAAFTMQELQGPEKAAMARLAAATDPQSAAAAALAYERPAGWTPNGDPSMASGWPTRLAATQAAYGGMQQTLAGAQQAPPPNSSAPYQVAANGPTPPPPSAPAQSQGAPMDQGAPVPQQPGVPPTGPQATPQEAAMIQQGLRFPQGSAPWTQALQLMQKIRERAATPIDAPKDMMWQGGRAVPIPGTGYNTVSQGPAGLVQSDPFGKDSVVSNPNAGAIPSGMMVQNGPNGPQLVPMGNSSPKPITDPAQRQALGILPSDRNAYAMGADGKVTKVADNPYGPKEIQSVHDNFWESDETKKAQEAYSAFSGLTTALQNAKGNNGPLDQAAIDSFLRGINPGMGARNSTVQMVMEHFGLPAELQGKVSSIVGNGFVTPQSLQQMLQITHDYALAHQSAAQTRAASDAKMVSPYGYGAADLAEDLPSLGPVPRINFGVNSGGGQPSPPRAPGMGGGLPGGQGAPQLNAQQARLQALRAELARRQAARQGAQQ